MRFSPTGSAHYVGLCRSKSRSTTITYVTKIYNLSEYEFAWWDLGGDNLVLGGDRAEKDSGGGDGVRMGIKLLEWGGDGDKIFYRVNLYFE